MRINASYLLNPPVWTLKNAPGVYCTECRQSIIEFWNYFPRVFLVSCVFLEGMVIPFYVLSFFSVLLSKTKVKSKRRDRPDRTSERPKTG